MQSRNYRFLQASRNTALKRVVVCRSHSLAIDRKRGSLLVGVIEVLVAKIEQNRSASGWNSAFAGNAKAPVLLMGQAVARVPIASDFGPKWTLACRR